MPNIYFVKDGRKANGDRITHRADISMGVASKVFGAYQVKYSLTPPTINPSVVASDFQPYKHVVFEVSEQDVTDSFPQVGYYLIEGLEASECQRILCLAGPAI